MPVTWRRSHAARPSGPDSSATACASRIPVAGRGGSRPWPAAGGQPPGSGSASAGQQPVVGVPVMTGWMTASHGAGPAGVSASSSCRVMSSSRRTGCPARCGSMSAPISRMHASSSASCRRCARVRVSSGPPGRASESSTASTAAAHRAVRSPSSRPAPSRVCASRTSRSSNPSSPSRRAGVLTAQVLGQERGCPGPRPARRRRAARRRPRRARRRGARRSSRRSAAPTTATRPVGQRRGQHRVGRQAAHPADPARGGPAGRLGLPGQPHPRRPVPVAGQAAARHAERRQHPRVRRGLPRLGHRQRPQAISLQPRRPLRRIRLREELQRRRRRTPAPRPQSLAQRKQGEEEAAPPAPEPSDRQPARPGGDAALAAGSLAAGSLAAGTLSAGSVAAWTPQDRERTRPPTAPPRRHARRAPCLAAPLALVARATRTRTCGGSRSGGLGVSDTELVAVA